MQSTYHEKHFEQFFSKKNCTFAFFPVFWQKNPIIGKNVPTGLSNVPSMCPEAHFHELFLKKIPVYVDFFDPEPKLSGFSTKRFQLGC